MGVVLIEGFDHMTASQVAAKGWSNAFASTQTGRFSGQAMRSGNASAHHAKLLPGTYSTLFAGVAIRPVTIAGAATYYFLQAGATNTLQLGIDASSRIRVLNSSGTLIATGTSVITAGTWYYIEVKLVIAGASGNIEVRLNGISGEIATTTGNFGSTNVDTVGLLGSSNSCDFDDLYCADTSGSSPRNTFLGDVRVETLRPSADGAHSQWTPSTGTNHSANVDETTPNDDTDYNSNSTAGNRDTFAYGDLVMTSGTIFGVQSCLYARKDDAGTRQIASVIRQGGTDNDGSTITLTATYAYYSQIYNQDPSVADWTISNVNGNEYGVKLVA